MPNDEELRLQAEWREIIRQELAELKAANKELHAAVSQMSSTLASYQIEGLRKAHDDHESRLRSLETFAWRMVGIVLGAQAVTSVGLIGFQMWLAHAAR